MLGLGLKSATPRDIKIYFERIIIPLITEGYPEVASEMSILVSGSFGLGIADESSDLDAVIYLDDPLWKAQGGQVQLLLEHCPHSFARTVGHPEICVHPSSWLLGGQHKEFLESKADLPWEQVTIEDLFEIQENLVVHDPHAMLRRLREVTEPERFPDWLWQKLLMKELHELVYNDLGEFASMVSKQKTLEAHIILGCILEDLVHIGFLINRNYYPWRKHWRWAFEKLPILTPTVLPHIDSAISSPDWDQKLASIEAVRDIYTEYIGEKGLLTPEILADLGWAIGTEAWANPNWRDRKTKCKQKAQEAGYDTDDWWVWSLWDWV